MEQFGGQAPGSSEEERQWAYRKFKVQFDVFDKVRYKTRYLPGV